MTTAKDVKLTQSEFVHYHEIAVKQGNVLRVWSKGCPEWQAEPYLDHVAIFKLVGKDFVQRKEIYASDITITKEIDGKFRIDPVLIESTNQQAQKAIV